MLNFKQKMRLKCSVNTELLMKDDAYINVIFYCLSLNLTSTMLGIIFIFALKLNAFHVCFHCNCINFICQDLIRLNISSGLLIFTYFISFLFFSSFLTNECLQASKLKKFLKSLFVFVDVTFIS